MGIEHWTDRLSDYIDGELNAQEAAALEAHLLECAECDRTVQQLRAVVARAGQVIDRPPETDLWPAIASRIATATAAVSDVVPIRRRRVTFSIPQLAAASVVLMLLSATSMYIIVNRTAAPGANAAQQANQAPVTTDRAVNMAVAVTSPAAENYDVAITELEGALETGRPQLDTATVRVLEANLRAIDVAISEAQAALGRDPGNPYLNRYLDHTMQKKIQLLRRATGILRAQT